jgi:hypothetical protein
MIRINCPRCQSVLQGPDHKAGSKISCPRCGQRLQIPLPPTNKTILAPLVSSSSAPAAPHRPLSRSQQQQPDIPEPEREPEHEPIVAERRSLPRLPQHVWVYVCIGGVVAVLGIASAFVYLAIYVTKERNAHIPHATLHEGEPMSKEEKTVADWIKEHSSNPSSLRYTRWGPHDLKSESADFLRRYHSLYKANRGIAALAPPSLLSFGELDLSTDRQLVEDGFLILRARWREINKTGVVEVQDACFLLHKGHVVTQRSNDEGDDWLDNLRVRSQAALVRLERQAAKEK